jgi:hypothetical protein
MVCKMTVASIGFKENFSFFENEFFKYYGSKKKNGVYAFDNLNAISISKRKKWFKSFYDIFLAKDDIAQVKTFGGLKANYECNYQGSNYFLYVHKGLATSIFLHDRQIGYIKKNKKNHQRTMNFEVVVNSDANMTLIFCLCLVLYMDYYAVSSYDEVGDVNVDFGNIGLEEFKFDENWKPL